MKVPTHKGDIGGVVAPPVGTEFLWVQKKVDKSKWCSACGGYYKGEKRKGWAMHTRCTGFRRTVQRETLPCECPCRKGLGILDPEL